MPPELERQILAVLAEDDARERAAHDNAPQADIPVPETPEQPPIWISKPAPLPADGERDAIQSAIHAVKAQPSAPLTATAAANGRLARIDQAFCGEIAGSITGQVFCYGYVRRESVRNNC